MRFDKNFRKTFYSRGAIAAIIGDIVVFFYNSKNLNLIRALSFYDSKRSIGFLKVFTTRRGVLVFLRFFLRLEEEYWFS